MRIVPAIDVLGGRAVRLTKGDPSTAVDVGNPVELAERFADHGAGFVHLVDLDAAFGGPRDDRLVRLVSRRIPTRVGGGIRSTDALEKAFDAGASEVVVGTWAYEDPVAFFDALAPDAARRVVLAADVGASGKVVTRGWTATAPTEPMTVIGYGMQRAVVKYLLTATVRDGTLVGPDMQLYADVKLWHPDVFLIASGGVRDTNDLDNLRSLGVDEVVVGKALYGGSLDAATLWDPES